MQPQEGWVTKEWMIKETAEAGFNVFSPRRGHDRIAEVRQVTEWCQKYGIYHMPWMRGSLGTPEGPEADGKRIVWASGSEQPLWSPNADEFWEWTNRYITEYAKISVENEHLIGVFLDYENYAPGRKEGNLYSLSYDDLIVHKFAQSKDIQLPTLDLAKRKEWLEKEGLHEEFSEFQINYWCERCRTLRQAVDEHNPKFQFCIYPAPGTPFMVEAAYPEWATKKAPLILADASTYGRPSKFLPQSDALEANRQKMLERMQIPKNAGIPFIYVGGIDPVVRGADPEFSGKNAVMISEVTDGYWIFYEGPTYTKQDHTDYWKWFTWANKAMAEGKFRAQHEPRETDENWAFDVFKSAIDIQKLVERKWTGDKVEFPIARLRRENILLLTCKTGRSVELTLQNQPVASYKSNLVWELRNPKMEKITSGIIPHEKKDTIKFTPEVDGVYLIGLSAGSCAYSAVSSNVPVGLYAGDYLSLIYETERLYFLVPDNVNQFGLIARGSGAETVRLNVFNPEGNQVATGQTTPQKREVTIEVSADHYAGQIWSLGLTKADEGVIEDNSIKLDPKLPPILSLIPEHVFTISPKRN